MIRDQVLVGVSNAADVDGPLNIIVPVVGTGLLYALHVKQTAGPTGGFSACLYSAWQAAPPNTPSGVDPVWPSDAPSIVAEGHKDIYRLFPPVVVAPGEDLAEKLIDTGMPYYNIHSNYQQRRDELYLQIIPTPTAEESEGLQESEEINDGDPAARTFDIRVVYEESDQ